MFVSSVSTRAIQVPVPGLSITLRAWRTMLSFRIPTPQRPNLSGVVPTFQRTNIEFKIELSDSIVDGLKLSRTARNTR